MRFGRVAVLDWSAARGPRQGRDSIWLGLVDPAGESVENLPTRGAAETRLDTLLAEARTSGVRLLLGVDFALGYPAGLADRLTGKPRALALWDWLAARVAETEGHGSTYRAVAAEMNRLCGGGGGPFWGDGTRAGTPGLPRRRPPLPPGLAAHRATEARARADGVAPKSVWQLAGAGAVGAQSLTGIPVLARLRAAHPLRVWPFEPVADAPLVVAEVYPSLLAAAVRAEGGVPDAAQVRLLARALWRLSEQGHLGTLFEGGDAEEGAILGAGQAGLLRAALAG